MKLLEVMTIFRKDSFTTRSLLGMLVVERYPGSMLHKRRIIRSSVLRPRYGAGHAVKDPRMFTAAAPHPALGMLRDKPAEYTLYKKRTLHTLNPVSTN